MTNQPVYGYTPVKIGGAKNIYRRTPALIIRFDFYFRNPKKTWEFWWRLFLKLNNLSKEWLILNIFIIPITNVLAIEE